MFYTSALIKKTKLESRKVELEIADRKSQVEKVGADPKAHPEMRHLTKFMAGPRSSRAGECRNFYCGS